MATQSTNRTLIVLAIIGVVIFAAWKLIPALANKFGSGSAQNSSVGGGGVSGDDGEDEGYYQPEQQSGLGSLLNSLLGMFGGGSKGSGSGSGSGGGNSGGGGTGGFGSGSSALSGIGGSDPLNSILTDLDLNSGSPEMYGTDSRAWW